MSNLITVDELSARLGDPALRIVDTRFSLQDPEHGRKAYEEGHIPGAIYFDLDEDLSRPQPPGTPGGRHPLPDMGAFAEKLGERGIGNEHHIVVYDDSGGMFAARFWWMLRYAGHDRVQVLDGGLGAWLEAGQAVTKALPSYPATRFELELRPEMLVDQGVVKAKLDNPDVLLIDARASERYRGENETLDRKAGHIPGALNKPFTENLDRGRFKDPALLAERFKEAAETEEVIVYCGSGVTAAHNVLALEEAGFKGARLYVGSWSDWTSDDANPVARGDEP